MPRKSYRLPSREELLAALAYDQSAGTINSKAGKNTYIVDGKVLIRVGKKVLQVKRVVWFLETGEWPKELIVHKNDNQEDCRFSNLMLVKPFSEPPTQEEISEWYEYRDGELLSKVTYKKLKKGVMQRECSNFYGYLRTGRLKREYLIHRLIYLLLTGEWPEQIDHIDGDKTNNRIENLRAANGEINGKNRKLSVKSSTGQNGVHLNKKNGRYRVVISIAKKFKNMGEFDDLKEAIAYRKELEKIHGYADAHNRPE